MAQNNWWHTGALPLEQNHFLEQVPIFAGQHLPNTRSEIQGIWRPHLIADVGTCASVATCIHEKPRRAILASRRSMDAFIEECAMFL